MVISAKLGDGRGVGRFSKFFSLSKFSLFMVKKEKEKGKPTHYNPKNFEAKLMANIIHLNKKMK